MHLVEDRLEKAKIVSCDVAVTAIETGAERHVEVLETEGSGKDQPGEDLARPSRGQPAIDPRKDHPRKKNVGQSEGDGRCKGPGQKVWPGYGDAEENGRRHQADNNVRGAEQTEGEPHEHVAALRHREADEFYGVEGGAGLAEVNVEQLRQGEGAPENDTDLPEVAAGSASRGQETCRQGRQQRQDGEQGKQKDAADKFGLAAFATEAVGQDAPAQPRDGEELRPAEAAALPHGNK